jgi:hypothetical protein
VVYSGGRAGGLEIQDLNFDNTEILQ